MAPITKLFLSALLASVAISAPLKRRQLHGEGEALDSLFTDTDNGVGYGVENAEDNAAALISGSKPAPAAGGSRRRQLHGEGEALDSLFTDTDNGVGYGVENAENNAAALISGGTPAPVAGGSKSRRQLDKIANGAGNVCTAAGGDCGNQVQSLDTIDGATTDGAANIGADTGSMEESTLEAAGSAVPSKIPKRQLDKISNGFGAVSNAAGTGGTTANTVASLDTVDGALTDGAANVGADVGSTEESTLEAAGSAVPSKIPRRFAA